MKRYVLFLILSIPFMLIAAEKSSSFWKEGILIHQSADKEFSMRLDVRLYLDYTKYFEDEEFLSDGTALRKGRFAVKTKLWENWQAEFDLDFAENTVEAKDMWVARNFSENTLLKFGHFKVPFSLEELTSSRFINFMERSYMNEFAPGRKMAAGITQGFNLGSISTAFYGQELDDIHKKQQDEGYGAAARLTLNPYNKNGAIIHLGGGYAWQTPSDNSESFEIKSEPEAKNGDAEFLNTGTIDNVKNITLSNLEAALLWQSFLLQGEYTTCLLKREESFDDYEFSGGYVFLSWMITGERRPYTVFEGEFGQIIPKREIGALELAFRYSHLKLSDYEIIEDEYVGVAGGISNSFTTAISWYFNPNVKLMINYNIVDNSWHANGDGDYPADYDFSLLQTRLLVSF